jgi:hypothetical protein
MEELAQLLEDLAPQAVRECGEGAGPACRDRRTALLAMARALRRLIEQDRPLNLSLDVPGSGTGLQLPVAPERPT